MSENVKVENRDEGFVLIKLKGRFLGGGENDPVDELLGIFKKLSDENKVKVVVDMHDVDFFASSAIGALVSGHTTMNKKNGELVLYRPIQYIKDSLKMVKLDLVLTIEDNLQDAVKHFGIELKENGE